LEVDLHAFKTVMYSPAQLKSSIHNLISKRNTMKTAVMCKVLNRSRWENCKQIREAAVLCPPHSRTYYLTKYQLPACCSVVINYNSINLLIYVQKIYFSYYSLMNIPVPSCFPFLDLTM